MKLLTVLLLCTFAVGCGYGSKTTTPPAAGTMPIITQLTPPSVMHSTASFQLEVDGTSFMSSAVINFNGTAETTTSPSAGKLQATIPATAIMSAGPVPVTVTNPGTPGGIYGGGTNPATSTPMTFTVQ